VLLSMRRRLINAYFDRVHPLRCLSFIHKPSFLQSLDNGSVTQDYSEPLLLIMCALGARHLYLDSITPSPPGVKIVAQQPGAAWAEKARRDVLAEMHVPSIQQVMAS
jgi:hypothetical protein